MKLSTSSPPSVNDGHETFVTNTSLSSLDDDDDDDDDKKKNNNSGSICKVELGPKMR